MVTLSNVKISNVDYCIQCDGEATINAALLNLDSVKRERSAPA